MPVVTEPTGTGGDGWIDTRAGRLDYNEEGDTESTYFNQPVQGQKRKKAPFFKYSKKRKGHGNTGSNSKGSVVSHVITAENIHFFFIAETDISPSFVACCDVDLGVDTAPISRGHHPAPEVGLKLQAGGAGAQQVRHLPAGDRAS